MGFLHRLKFHLWYYQRLPPPWDTGITPPEVDDFIASHEPGRALDLGCGTGTNVITLARRGWQVTGVDFAWSAIHYARRKLKQAGVHADLRVEDVTRLHGVAGPFDLILDIGCFHNLPSDGRLVYLEKIERLLARTGTFLLYVHIKSDNAEQGHGVVGAELQQIAARLRLVSRRDGTERGHTPSAWLAYTLPAQPSPGPEAMV